MKTYYVYILSNQNRTVYYVGMTNNLHRRLEEHQPCHKQRRSFTHRYNVNELIYYETYGRAEDAIAREKELKGWRRQKKLALVKQVNPTLKNLNDMALLYA